MWQRNAKHWVQRSLWKVLMSMIKGKNKQRGEERRATYKRRDEVEKKGGGGSFLRVTYTIFVFAFCLSTSFSLSSPIVPSSSRMSEVIHTADAHSPLDLVIANAGISVNMLSSRLYTKVVNPVFDTNVQGVFNTILPAAELMKTR